VDEHPVAREFCVKPDGGRNRYRLIAVPRTCERELRRSRLLEAAAVIDRLAEQPDAVKLVRANSA
jgi:hypothetical protein